MKMEPAEENGFTLIELLLVSVLLAVLSAILYSTITAILSSRAMVNTEREITRTAQHVLERMSKELIARVVSPLSPRGFGSEYSDAPVRGRIYFLGVNKGSGKDGADIVRFVTSHGSPAQVGGNENYGLVEVEYRLDEAKEDFSSSENSRSGEERLKVSDLIRLEQPAEVSDQDVQEKRRFRTTIAQNITSMNFRYLKNGAWQDSWENQGATIPEAIEISFSVQGVIEPTVRHFRTAIALSKARQTSSVIGQTN
jgi:prepilin-type N-terminal cleavage/methylation domain-containing protein